MPIFPEMGHSISKLMSEELNLWRGNAVFLFTFQETVMEETS